MFDWRCPNSSRREESPEITEGGRHAPREPERSEETRPSVEPLFGERTAGAAGGAGFLASGGDRQRKNSVSAHEKTRLVPRSETKTRPNESMAMPVGALRPSA